MTHSRGSSYRNVHVRQSKPVVVANLFSATTTLLRPLPRAAQQWTLSGYV
jgi:hypothetical protein